MQKRQTAAHNVKIFFFVPGWDLIAVLPVLSQEEVKEAPSHIFHTTQRALRDRKKLFTYLPSSRQEERVGAIWGQGTFDLHHFPSL